MPSIYVGDKLVANLGGGGLKITANSKDRLYLLGSNELVTSDKTDLYTYNGTTYFEGGEVYAAGDRLLKSKDLPSRNKQSSIIASGYLHMVGTTSITAPDGLHYNTEYVSGINAWKIQSGIGLTVNFRTSALLNKYKRMIIVTPQHNDLDITQENYLSCTVGTAQAGNNASFYIYVFDTNNGSNLKESGYGASFLIPNVELEY